MEDVTRYAITRDPETATTPEGLIQLLAENIKDREEAHRVEALLFEIARNRLSHWPAQRPVPGRPPRIGIAHILEQITTCIHAENGFGGDILDAPKYMRGAYLQLATMALLALEDADIAVERQLDLE